jgi:RNA polymerase sigma-70 factor, ECF subfamily
MERFPFDDEYVRRLREGDRETWQHFEAYFRDLLLIKLSRKLNSKQAIEDVRQEVYKRVLMKLSELEDGRKLGAFVNSVCNRVLWESYRDAARSSGSPHDSTENDIADQTNLLEELITRESDARVRRVLSRLKPPRDAEILRAIFLDDGDKAEVCRRFGVDRTYLRVLLHRAKEKFRSEFRRKSGRLQIPETFSGQSSLLM